MIGIKNYPYCSEVLIDMIVRISKQFSYARYHRLSAVGFLPMDSIDQPCDLLIALLTPNEDVYTHDP